MMRFWPGETVRVEIAFTDGAGAAVAATGVAVQWRRDAEAPVAAAVVDNGGVGLFRADIVASEPGEYAVRATCAAPTSAAVEASFTVVPGDFA